MNVIKQDIIMKGIEFLGNDSNNDSKFLAPMSSALDLLSIDGDTRKDGRPLQ